ncbi:MAG: hypothetical protein AAF628_16590 [Planctomycetota bacterium]
MLSTLLAIRGSELPLPVAIIGTVFFFIYLMTRTTARERESKRRIELVEKALSHGHIDEATKREMLAAVTGQRDATGRISPTMAAGWVGLFVGLGLTAAALIGAGDARDLWLPAVMTTAISFGVISLPLAQRELQDRRDVRQTGGERHARP